MEQNLPSLTLLGDPLTTQSVVEHDNCKKTDIVAVCKCTI